MDAIKRFKEICLFNKVMKELEISTSLKKEIESEKEQLNILTNYIIDMASSCKDLNDFINKLNGSDADFNISTINIIYATVKELNDHKKKNNSFNNQTNPKYNTNEEIQEEDKFYNEENSQIEIQDNEKEILAKKFTSLALPNRNKEELDIEFGVVFEEEVKVEEKPNNKYNFEKYTNEVKNEEKIKKRKSRSRSISPIKYDENKKNNISESKINSRKNKKYRNSRSRSISRSRSNSRKKLGKYKRKYSDSEKKSKKEKSRNKSRSISAEISDPNLRKNSLGRKDRKEETRKTKRDRKRSSSSSDDYNDRKNNKKNYDKEKKKIDVEKNQKEEFKNFPQEGVVYQGTIVKLQDWGAFVRIDNLKNKYNKPYEGLVHVSQIKNIGRVSSTRDILSLNQRVFAKILSIDNLGKISLTMKNIDQRGFM